MNISFASNQIRYAGRFGSTSLHAFQARQGTCFRSGRTAKDLQALQQLAGSKALEAFYYLMPNNTEIAFMPKLQFEIIPHDKSRYQAPKLRISLVCQKRPTLAEGLVDLPPEILGEVNDEIIPQAGLPEQISLPVREIDLGQFLGQYNVGYDNPPDLIVALEGQTLNRKETMELLAKLKTDIRLPDLTQALWTVVNTNRKVSLIPGERTFDLLVELQNRII